jgi:hypothetical protein
MISSFRPEPEETPEKPAAIRASRIRRVPVWLLTCAGAACDPGEGEQVGGQTDGRDAAARGAETDLGDNSGSDQAFKAAGVVEAEFHALEDAARAGGLSGLGAHREALKTARGRATFATCSCMRRTARRTACR